jgi:hypothetical protein
MLSTIIEIVIENKVWENDISRCKVLIVKVNKMITKVYDNYI